ncbi:alpha/beta hydrolase family protein [Vibrio alginolyticus]
MKTKIIMSFLLASLCVSVSASTNEPKYHSALTVKTVFSEDRDKPVEVYYWYPTTNGKTNFTFGRGNIFKSVETQLDAPLASGKFPVVLLSQGGTRSAFSHSGWIASGLAKQGYIVVVPKPPAPNEINAEMAVDEITFRTSDLVLGLNELSSVGILSGGVDTDEVQGVGFFLGGTSMLMLSGAQISPEKYRTSCHNVTNVDCHWLRENNVDITNIPDQKFPRFQSESKLKSVVVINPELTKTFVPETLALMKNIITVVTLSDRLHPALTPAESLVALPNVTFQEIPSASQFSAFAECTERGIKILASEREEALCQERDEVSRKDNHQQILDVILARLTKS